MSLIITTPYRAPIVKPPIEATALPRFGLGRAEDVTNMQVMDIILGTEHSDPLNSPQFFLPAIGEMDYYYYASPVAYGLATFRDPSGFQGGFDGASWPLDDVGEEYGPLAFLYHGEPWYLYRTDFPSGPGGTYSVTFANG